MFYFQKTVENANGEGLRQYSLPRYGTRNASSQVKEEGGDDELLEVKLEYQFSSENQENTRTPDDLDDSLDNETLANRMCSVGDSDDLRNDYSSDDSMCLSAKKKLLKEKNKVKSKKKVQAKKEVGQDIVKQGRTIQTQTGTDEDFSLEVVEAVGEGSLDDTITSLDKKKIKSRKTQTPKEKSPKKRFRIRPAIPSSCTLCDKVYKNSEILRQHMKSHHVTGTIECPNCKLTFTSLRSLKYHEQRKHSNLEPVPCTFCGKKFLDKKYLRIHENIHSQVNQYVCQFCGRKFMMKTNLTVHISRHHTLKTNDFICQVCGKAFPFKLYLKKHFKTHTDYKPYQCSYCEAKFRENALLRKHVNSIHLKLRPFLCQYCTKTFTRSLYLREHMESQHLGIQKKIECSRCGENFQNRNRLRQHECEGRLEVM